MLICTTPPQGAGEQPAEAQAPLSDTFMRRDYAAGHQDRLDGGVVLGAVPWLDRIRQPDNAVTVPNRMIPAAKPIHVRHAEEWA